MSNELELTEYKWNPNEPDFVNKVGELRTIFVPITFSKATSEEEFEDAFATRLGAMTYRRELSFGVDQKVTITAIGIQKGYEKFFLGTDDSKRSLNAFIRFSADGFGVGFEKDSAVPDEEGAHGNSFVRGELAQGNLETGIVAKLSKKFAVTLGVESHNKLAVGNTDGSGTRVFTENDFEAFTEFSYAFTDYLTASIVPGTERHNGRSGSSNSYRERVDARIEGWITLTGVPKIFQTQEKGRCCSRRITLTSEALSKFSALDQTLAKKLLISTSKSFCAAI